MSFPLLAERAPGAQRPGPPGPANMREVQRRVTSTNSVSARGVFVVWRCQVASGCALGASRKPPPTVSASPARNASSASAASVARGKSLRSASMWAGLLFNPPGDGEGHGEGLQAKDH
jgi:hypothetical protein